MNLYQDNNDTMAINNNKPVVTMAYMVMQPLESTYEVDEVMQKGTLFPNLDKPFMGDNTIENNMKGYDY